MKWLALALVVLNVGVWQISEALGPGLSSVPAVSGNLPRVASLKIQDEPVTPVQLAPGERACVRLGWIQSPERARELLSHIPGGKVSRVSVEEIDRSLPSLHWVIVPPQPPAAAQEQLRAMRNQGIDSYLVTEGENKNAISLGLFESLDAAMSVLEEKKRNNFNVVLVNFDRNQISYALALETESSLVEEVVQAVEADYGLEFDFIEVDRCESVATPGKNP
ncbi:hypothetical protein GCM10011533_29600 [Streptosporangium jomthongense]|uniref:SPOR domain-containing protein n=1 Tax=Marinobacter aromaticivorans TaxID=1494078 RepID=A0ABW2IYC9_9GAMM|nr:hypothetical protein [Marinobacter aromaticivorans]GGE75285.1 hypothetical protein GCM10011533_29600 [Streptosporangium jomthongense]